MNTEIQSNQSELLKELSKYIETKKFPSFTLLIGQDKAEILEIARWVVSELKTKYGKVSFMQFNSSKAEIDRLIECVYDINNPNLTIYYIDSIDTANTVASNSLLKLVEEPRTDNTVFIASCSNIYKVIPTLYSRATKYTLNRYDKTFLKNYLKVSVNDLSNDELDLLANSVKTPCEVDKVVKYGAKNYIDFAYLVFNNIAKTSGTNALKLADKFSTKDIDNKIDLKIFWNMFITLCLNQFNKRTTQESLSPILCCLGATTTAEALQELTLNNSCNKLMLIDKWIMDIRKVWRK